MWTVLSYSANYGDVLCLSRFGVCSPPGWCFSDRLVLSSVFPGQSLPGAEPQGQWVSGAHFPLPTQAVVAGFHAMCYGLIAGVL